jgi:hypothetical protein
MYFSTALLVAVPIILRQVSAEPLPTPAPVPHLDLIRDAQFRRNMIAKRADLHFCYGDGSICAASNDLYEPCQGFVTDTDSTKYIQCICEGGWVSTSEA